MNWAEFVKQVAHSDPVPALTASNRPILAVDGNVPEGLAGIGLEKKDGRNPLGETRSSVLQLVHDLAYPLAAPAMTDLAGIGDLLKRVRLLVSDASPDSVTSVVFFAACQSGIKVPVEVWAKWLLPITTWESTGNAADPERSWPALASALAHRHFGSAEPSGRQPLEEIVEAWRQVLPFLAEALREGYDPADVPADASGKYLASAHAALAEERARYRRRAFASDIHQISLPIANTTRRRLVDALFTREAEFAGVLKLLARNDRAGSPMGHGFVLLSVERAALHATAPEYWLTISVDPNAGVHLHDLWAELERLETEAWYAAGIDRPQRNESSREIAAIDAIGRVYHEPWYLDPTGTLVASPKRQIAGDTPQDEQADVPGSRLSAEDVRRAIFCVYDPLAGSRVHLSRPARDQSATVSSEPVPLLEVPWQTIRMDGESTGKRMFAAWWSPEETLPHPAGGDPLPPSVLRAMAARTLGAAPEDAYLVAPDREDFEVITFGNGFAVVSDGGAFLLDSGRGGRSRIGAARELVERQAKLSAELDAVQGDIAQRSHALSDDLRKRGRTGDAIRRQRECARLNARLIEARCTLDVPLQTDEAGLMALKETLARRWNTRARLDELVSEIEALDRSSRTAEELRLFHVGRVAAGVALGLLATEALRRPLTIALGWEKFLGRWEETGVFSAIFVATIIAGSIVERVLRQSVGKR